MAVSRDRHGQSILEFLFMLPVLVGLTTLMLKVNMAIQVSIVNQQYVRAVTLFQTYNSPIYPNLELRQSQLTAKHYNHMLVGMSGDSVPVDAPDDVAIHPSAPEQNIGNRRAAGNNEAQLDEPKLRSRVRIRNTVTLCTQPNVIGPIDSAKPILDVTRELKAAGKYALDQSSYFDYCGGPTKYE